MAQSAIQQRSNVPRSGTSRNPQEVTHVLESLRQDCNVVAPQGIDGVRLPNGFSIVWSEVYVDTREAREGGEIYNTGGAYGISYTALCRMADAFGVAWDGARSTYDQPHPHKVTSLAVGTYMDSDGMLKQISGRNNSDLRDNSAGFEDYRKPDGTLNEKMLRMQRKKIVEISESKARARAFRTSVGLRAMSKNDIMRPWIIFKVKLTGETDDPRTQRMFEAMIFQNAMNARASLYGPPAQSAPALAAPQPVPQLAAGSDFDEYGELPMGDDDYESNETSYAEPAPQPAAQPAQQTTRQSPPPQRGSAPRQQGGSGSVCKFGKNKGQALSDLTDGDLEWYVGALQKSVDDPSKEQYRSYNERDLRAAHDEQDRRNASDDAPPPTGDSVPF